MATVVGWASRATRILARRDDLANLTSGQPAVLVCEPDGTNRKQPDGGLRLLALRRDTRPGSFLLQTLSAVNAQNGGTDLVELSNPPANVAVVVGAPDVVQQISEWWTSVSGNNVPAIVAADEATGELDWSKVAEALSNSLHAAQTREAANLGALFALRSENEQLRRAVDSMGMVLSAGELPKSRLRYEAAPSSNALALEAQSSFEQIIDLPASETSSVAVKVVSFSDTSPNETYLRVTLSTVESGTVLGVWGVSFADLKRGWIVLDLPRPVPELLETLIVQVSVLGEAGGMVALALSDRRSLSAALEDRDSKSEEGLAIRLYSASAGRFVLPDFFLWEHAYTPSDERILFALPEESWRRIRILDSSGDIAINPERGLRVFEPDLGTVSVRIPNVRVPALDQLVTTVRTLGDRAGSVEVALLIVRSGSPDINVADLFDSFDCIGFSQWKKLDTSVSEITLGLVVPPNAGFDLVLAARTPYGEHAKSVAVQWDEIRFGRGNYPRAEMATVSTAAAPVRAPQNVSRNVVQSLPYCVPGRIVIKKEQIFGENYRHIVLHVQNLNFEDRFWKTLMFKIQEIDGRGGLEFRAHDGNAPFKRWPSPRSDDFGPFFALREEVSVPERAQYLQGIEGLDPADRKFLRDLVLRLPKWIELAVVQADRTDFSGIPDWVAVAQRLSERIDDLIPERSAAPKIAKLSA